MKKLIIFITSNDPSVGTPVDVVNYKNFFKSPIGGCWHEDEMRNFDSMNKETLIKELNRIRWTYYDYIICIFTGHGGIKRSTGETMLQLASEEEISEECLHKIAPRQLSIFDCCRAEYNDLEKKSSFVNKLNENSSEDFHVRYLYDAKILQTPKDYQCCLYACQRGETAEGEAGTGGIFSNCLLNAHKYIVDKEIIRINEIFQVATNLCKDQKQTPDMRSPRFMRDWQLVWALHLQEFMPGGQFPLAGGANTRLW